MTVIALNVGLIRNIYKPKNKIDFRQEVVQCGSNVFFTFVDFSRR